MRCILLFAFLFLFPPYLFACSCSPFQQQQEKKMDALADLSNKFLAGRNDLRGVDVASKWRLLLTDEEIQTAVKKLAAKIDEKFAGKDLVLTCILKGAVYFLVDLSRYLTVPHSLYFIEASSYQGSQLQSDKVEVLSNLVPSKFEGKHVLLIDELWDNGRTLDRVKNIIIHDLGHKNEDITTCTLFLKTKEQPQFPLPDLYGLEMPGVWVVGYGLDDQQEKRGWSYLYGIPKADSTGKQGQMAEHRLYFFDYFFERATIFSNPR